MIGEQNVCVGEQISYRRTVKSLTKYYGQEGPRTGKTMDRKDYGEERLLTGRTTDRKT